jgi:hypothetical protein
MHGPNNKLFSPWEANTRRDTGNVRNTSSSSRDSSHSKPPWKSTVVRLTSAQERNWNIRGRRQAGYQSRWKHHYKEANKNRDASKSRDVSRTQQQLGPKESQRQQLHRASPNSRVKRATAVAARAPWTATSARTLSTAEMFVAKEHWQQQSRKSHWHKQRL